MKRYSYVELYELILEEMYGAPYNSLKELSSLCKKNSIDWYKLFYVSEELIKDFPKKSKYRRFKKAKELFAEPLGLMFNFSPTTSLEAQFEESRKYNNLLTEKNEDYLKIDELLNSINLWCLPKEEISE